MARDDLIEALFEKPAEVVNPETPDEILEKISYLFLSGRGEQALELARAIEEDLTSNNMRWTYFLYRAFADMAQKRIYEFTYSKEPRNLEENYSEAWSNHHLMQSVDDDPRIMLMTAFKELTEDAYPQWWIDPNLIPQSLPGFKFLFDEKGRPLMLDGPEYVPGWDKLDDLVREGWGARKDFFTWIKTPEIQTEVNCIASLDLEKQLVGELIENNGSKDFDPEYREMEFYGPIEPIEEKMRLRDRNWNLYDPMGAAEKRWNRIFMGYSGYEEDQLRQKFQRDFPLTQHHYYYTDEKRQLIDSDELVDMIPYYWKEEVLEEWKQEYIEKSYHVNVTIDVLLECHNCLPQNAWFAMLPNDWSTKYLERVGDQPFLYTTAETLTLFFVAAGFMRIFKDLNLSDAERKRLKITDVQIVRNLLPFIVGTHIDVDKKGDPHNLNQDGLAKQIEDWVGIAIQDAWRKDYVESITIDITNLDGFTLP